MIKQWQNLSTLCIHKTTSHLLIFLQGPDDLEEKILNITKNNGRHLKARPFLNCYYLPVMWPVYTHLYFTFIMLIKYIILLVYFSISLTRLNKFDVEYLLDMSVVGCDLEDSLRYVLDAGDVDRCHILRHPLPLQLPVAVTFHLKDLSP